MIKKVICSCSAASNNVYNFFLLKFRNVKYGDLLKINGKLFIRGNGDIRIGNNVTINSSLESNPIGGNTKTTIHCFENAEIIIGNNVGISNCAMVSKVRILIGDWVKIGGNVKIYDTDFHSVDFAERRMQPDPGIKSKEIRIEEDAFIGAHSIILKGVKIGKASIIAAGSIVTKDVPSGEVWGGAPARFIKKI